VLQQNRAFFGVWVPSRVLQELNPCPRCSTEEGFEDMSVGSLGRAHTSPISNPTPGENDSQSRGGCGVNRAGQASNH
jgi:hypothetical protein